jgi:hypothetical protein
MVRYSIEGGRSINVLSMPLNRNPADLLAGEILGLKTLCCIRMYDLEK